MKIIISTVIIALVIGFLLGLLLGLFKKIFFVKTDPKIQEVRDALSGANCGGCGFAGCDSFAEAVVKGDAPVNGCVAGGASCADKIASILGSASAEVKPKIAVLACQGNKDCALEKGFYVGVNTCKGSQLVSQGTKKCSYGCIGFGDCVNACPFEAITMNKNGLPQIDAEKCVGCGNCAKTCPKSLFVLIEKGQKRAIAKCSSRSDAKAQIRKDCSAGCFKCGLCTKKCPEGAVTLVNGLPSVDTEKCTACGICVSSCPDKVMQIV